MPTYDLHFETITGRKPARTEHPLETQMVRVKMILQRYTSKYGTSITFICGQGEGILRDSIISYVKQRYPAYIISDASFHQYGGAAIKIYIKK